MLVVKLVGGGGKQTQGPTPRFPLGSTRYISPLSKQHLFLTFDTSPLNLVSFFLCFSFLPHLLVFPGECPDSATWQSLTCPSPSPHFGPP